MNNTAFFTHVQKKILNFSVSVCVLLHICTLDLWLDLHSHSKGGMKLGENNEVLNYLFHFYGDMIHHDLLRKGWSRLYCFTVLSESVGFSLNFQLLILCKLNNSIESFLKKL